MDGTTAIADIAERLARAGMITHAVRLDPDALPGTPFDADLESAALAALCDLVSGQVFRLEAFAYGFHAAGEDGGRVAGLADALGEALFGEPVPGLVAIEALAPDAGVPGLPEEAVRFVGALSRAAGEAAGPDRRAILDAAYALAAAERTAERIDAALGTRIEALGERLRAVFPAPVAVPRDPMPAAPPDLGSLVPALLPALVPALASALEAALRPALEAGFGRIDALADRIAAIEARPAAAASAPAGDAAEDLGPRILAELAPLAARVAELHAERERPQPILPSFKVEAEGLARLSLGLQALMRRLDGHAGDLEDTIARLQARLAETETGAAGLDERLAGVEAALLRFGEARRGEAPVGERALLRALEPLLGQSAAVATRLGELAAGLAAEREGRERRLAEAAAAAIGQAAERTLDAAARAFGQDLQPVLERQAEDLRAALRADLHGAAAAEAAVAALLGPIEALGADLREGFAALGARLASAEGAGRDTGAQLAPLAEGIAALAARAEPADPGPALDALGGRLDAILAEIGRLDLVRRALPDIQAEREGLQRLSVALQTVLRRLDAQAAALEGATGRLAETAGTPLADLIGARLETLGARVMAAAERGGPDLAPVLRRIDRMGETLQHLATRAAVSAQSLGPERARLQQVVIALQALAEDVTLRLARPGGEGEADPDGADPAGLAALAESAAEGAATRLAGALGERFETLEARLRDAAGAERLSGLAERIGGVESALDALAARLGAQGQGARDAEGIENRLFGEIGNLRLMLGGLRSSLREIERGIAGLPAALPTPPAPAAPARDPEVAARLDQISFVLAEYLSRFEQRIGALPGPSAAPRDGVAGA